MANIYQKSIVKLSPHPDLVNQLRKQLLKHGGLKITGFGMFTLKRMKGVKNGINPYDGKRQAWPPYTKIVFKPVKSLKDEIQKWHKK